MIRPAEAPRSRPKLVTSASALAPVDTTVAELKSYIDRIIRLHEERKGLSQDISDILAEAKSRGYDRKGLAGTVKRLMGDQVALGELDNIIDLYLSRYHGTGTEDATHRGAPAQPRRGA